MLALQVLQGIINSFDTPARQAFVGPSIGGVVIAAVGEGWCFTADAISYLRPV